MNKKVLFAATVAAVLASCSSDDLSVQTAAKQEAQGLENAVSFEAYSQRSLTRAGAVGAMDNDQLKTNGFGVFGYYTDMNEYDQTSTPNFMYNQEVKYNGGSWTYEPVKYWPNEYGNKAQSDDVDKLSFFAYAPYVENTPSTGKVEAEEDLVGITGFTRNTAAGDPYVKYVGSLDPAQCVDLCWGVASDQDWNIINGGSQRMSAGMPWLNVQRPQKSLGQKMKFTFKHALSQLNVQIDADVNTNQHGQGAELNANTKVFVRSVTFSGFAMKGALNLNNEEAGTPNWKGYNCSNEPLQSEEYTVYDGMKDGKEGTGYTASNEKVTGLNEKIIQDKAWNQSAEGVTKTAKNLFNSETVDAPIYVIPTGDDMTVTIVYDIETKDANLAGTVSDLETAGVSIENKITKTITLTSADAMKLEAGKKYTIQLHLGLSQVEFDATVDEWQDAESAAGEAWLPENGQGDAPSTFSTLSELKDNVATADDSYLGWYVDGNGNISATDGGSSVGRIAYYGTDDVETASGTQNILVIATANATSSSVAWKTAGGAGESAYNSTSAMNGKAFTDQYGSDAGYPAAYAAAHYSATAPSGSTGWFLPSYAQWQKMIDAGHTGITSDIMYWSSTECAGLADYAWRYHFYGSLWNPAPKNDNRQVRAAFAY